MVGFTALLCYAFIQVHQIQKTLSTYVGENMIWAITQTEREARRLGEATLISQRDGADDDQLSLRFDVLYSRFALLADGPQLRYFSSLGAADIINRNADILQRVEKMIDEPAKDRDPSLIYQTLLPMMDDLSKLANLTMVAERDTGGAQRDQQLKIIYLIMTAVIGLMATGALMLWQLISSMRAAANANFALQQHKDQLEQTVAQRTSDLIEALKSEKQAKEIYKSFITTVSHQFRTPVSIIDMIAQRFIRRSGDFPPAVITEKASRIRMASRRLIQLLESTTNAERLEDNEITLAKQYNDFIELVRNAILYHQELFPEQQINITAETSPDRCYCDGVLVEQIIVNLLANAAKYSPAHEPIDVIVEETNSDFLCSVRDRGIGIPEDERDRIFTRFFRASNVSHMAGTGLGLSLSRSLAGFHSGTLTFQSTQGEGSVFTLSLPKEPPHAAS